MKRGNPSTLTPAVEAEMERLWCGTTLSHDEIAARVNALHGTSFKPSNVRWHAKRRAWVRGAWAARNPHNIEERLLTKSFLRDAKRAPEPDRIALVAPGTFKARGFSMLNGRIV